MKKHPLLFLFFVFLLGSSTPGFEARAQDGELAEKLNGYISCHNATQQKVSVSRNHYVFLLKKMEPHCKTGHKDFRNDYTFTTETLFYSKPESEALKLCNEAASEGSKSKPHVARLENLEYKISKGVPFAKDDWEWFVKAYNSFAGRYNELPQYLRKGK